MSTTIYDVLDELKVVDALPALAYPQRPWPASRKGRRMNRESARLGELLGDLHRHRARYDEEHYPALLTGLDDTIKEAQRLLDAATAFEAWARLPQPVAVGRWNQLLRGRGAVGAARHVLRPGANLDTFYDLLKMGRVDATVEQTALRPEFVILFTDSELDEAYMRLHNEPRR